MKKQRTNKDFLHLPTYPGGKDAFREFIKNNLRYPKEALEKKIQGKVYVSYDVNDNGDVLSAIVTKGIGYGCDEEAVRIVMMLKYDKVKNRGVRLKSTIKTFIDFKLTEIKQAVNINYVPSKKPDKPVTPKKEGESYSYTIKF
ncbi:MAG: energy transducer TonB [Bacteroidales bacterium]